MRILFYINTLAGGGAQRVMANLANMFAESGDEVIFVTSFAAQGEYALGEKVVRCSLSDKRIESFVKRNVYYISVLRKQVRKYAPDVVVSFMSEPNYRNILATAGLPVKKIISVRCDPVREYAGKLGRFMAKNLLPMADGCVFQTQDAKIWFPEKLQEKSRIIVNAVKKDFYAVERKPVPGRIVTLGRLSHQKNHKLLIDAFAMISPDYPNAQLHIYGEGDLQKQLSDQIAQQNLTGKVCLMGPTANVEGVLAEADLFVLSSDYEGMPNALMEAMAAGVPCISTSCPCGGPEMLIRNHENGLLVPIQDGKALAEAMKQLLADPAFSADLGQAAKEAALDFLPEKVFAQWKEYISSFVGDDTPKI